MQKIKKLFLTIPLVILLTFSINSISHAEENMVGTVICDVLNIRESSDLSHKIISQAVKGEKMKIVSSSEKWHRINYKGIDGWVHGDYVTVKIEPIGIGTINANDVNMRSGSNLSSDVVTRLNKGVVLEVFEQQEEWYKVKLTDGKYAWVYGKYLTVREEGAASRGNTDSDNTLGSKIVEYAKNFIGVKYVYGGTSPKGFDCSGLVQYTYKNFGIKLERVAASQAKYGTKVDKSNLRSGDLVFFDTNGGMNSIEHVGIYIGNGKFIHASSGRGAGKVVISDLSTGYYSNTYMWARRYISE